MLLHSLECSMNTVSTFKERYSIYNTSSDNWIIVLEITTSSIYFHGCLAWNTLKLTRFCQKHQKQTLTSDTFQLLVVGFNWMCQMSFQVWTMASELCVFNLYVTRRLTQTKTRFTQPKLGLQAGDLWLRVTRFNTRHESWRNVPKMATNSPRRHAEMLCMLIKCNARGDVCLYKDPITADRNKSQPLTCYCLYLPASMDKCGEIRKTRKSGC